MKPNSQPPAEVFLKHKEWVLQQVKSGVAEAAYTFAGSSNGMCIVNADGPEQLNDFMMLAPAGPYCDAEVLPLPILRNKWTERQPRSNTRSENMIGRRRDFRPESDLVRN